jgi:anaerobic selenocysteine-containing dehydrogenase
VRIRPGTDAALALAVAHEIFTHGWHDEPWLEAHALGWRAYRERAATCPPERAAQLTGLSADDIRRLAALYAGTLVASRAGAAQLRPEPPRHGATMIRAVALLPALVGDWARPGGGARLSTSAGFALNRKALFRQDLEPHPTRIVNMSRLGEALTTLTPPVHALFVYSANPGTSNPDQKNVHAGLAREDLFTVVHEQFMTDTASYADVLLPSTMQMEHSDLLYAYGHYHLQLNRPAVPPPGDCRPLFDLFQALAKKMGLTDPCFDQTLDELVAVALDNPANPRLEGITLERLERERSVPLKPQSDRFPVYTPWLDGRFDTPSKKVEFVSSLFQGYGWIPCWAR